MRELTKEIVDEYFRKNQIELRPTQSRLCIPILNRIYRKMLIGIRFSEIKIYNGLICEGHHRYVASLLASYSLGTSFGVTTSATIITDWKLLILDKNDWDTPEKVNILNEQDARFNNIPLDKLIEMLR